MPQLSRKSAPNETMSRASWKLSLGHATPYDRRLASITALSASKSTLRCGAMPKPASHWSMKPGKLPVSCWLRNTEPPAVPRLRASPSFCETSVSALSQEMAFQAPFSFTIGPRRRSGL
jgi:hypothetical protein